MINKVHVEWGADRGRQATGYGDPEGYGGGMGTLVGYCYGNGSIPISVKDEGRSGYWCYGILRKKGNCAFDGKGRG